MAKKKRKNTPRLDPIDSTMSLGDHLEELRARILLALMGLAVGMIISLIFGKQILAIIQYPYNAESDIALQNLEPAGGFIIYFKVSLIAGLILTSPWVFYQLWAFVAAGLYPKERRYVYTSLPFSVVLFVTGAMFFLLIVARLSMAFFLRFDAWLGIQSGWTLQKYVSFVTILMLVFGLGFQTPIAIYILNRTGLVSIATLKKCRRYVLFGVFVIAAIATPPDVVSQIMLAFPLYALYELGMVLSWMAGRKAEKAAADEDDDGPDDDGGGSSGGGGDLPDTDDGGEPSGVAAAITGEVPDSAQQPDESADVEIKPEDRSYGEDNAYVDDESYSEADAREDAGEYGYEYGDGGEYDYGDGGEYDYGVGDPSRAERQSVEPHDVEAADDRTDEDSELDVREYKGEPYGYDDEDAAEQGAAEADDADGYDSRDSESHLEVREYTGEYLDDDRQEAQGGEEIIADAGGEAEADLAPDEPGRLEVREYTGSVADEDTADIQNETRPEDSNEKTGADSGVGEEQKEDVADESLGDGDDEDADRRKEADDKLDRD